MDRARLAWPTVVIGGAPRCGTSSLYDLLHASGAFRRQPRKELFLLNDPGFWIQGSSPGFELAGENCYELAGFGGNDRFIDASTTYLYQDCAPAACARWLDAHRDLPFVVVFCLREPAERLISSFYYFRDELLCIPQRLSLAEYVASVLAGTQRTANQQIDCALDHGLYPRYLERWRSAVGVERLELVRTEELASSPDAVVARIGARLGLDLTAGAREKRNVAFRPRFRALQRLGRLLGASIPHGALRDKLKTAYFRLAPAADRAAPRPEDEAARERVQDYYRSQRDAFAAWGLPWYGARR